MTTHELFVVVSWGVISLLADNYRLVTSTKYCVASLSRQVAVANVYRPVASFVSTQGGRLIPGSRDSYERTLVPRCAPAMLL